MVELSNLQSEYNNLSKEYYMLEDKYEDLKAYDTEYLSRKG